MNAFVCHMCGHDFGDVRALGQHQRHSKRCKITAYRRITTMDMELQIKSQMARTVDDKISDLRAALENIEIIAKLYGTRTNVREIDRRLQAASALDTISNLAQQALIGA